MQWGVVLAMAGWCLSTDLVRQWPGRDTVYLCPTMHGLQLGVEDMAHCVAAYHFSCLLDEIIALRCASVPGRAADIRLADASIQYLGFVMFSGFIPTCLPVDALYEAWRFVNGIIILAGRVQMVVLGRPVRPGHTLEEFVSDDNALTILVCYTLYAVSTE